MCPWCLVSYVPSIWKDSNITPVPKIHPPTDEGDIRPISLTPCISKVLEGFVVKWMISDIRDKIDPVSLGVWRVDQQLIASSTWSITGFLISTLPANTFAFAPPWSVPSPNEKGGGLCTRPATPSRNQRALWAMSSVFTYAGPRGGYFLVKGYWRCAAGWGYIFTTGPTIMGLHFSRVTRMGSHIFRDFWDKKILVSRDLKIGRFFG